MNLEGNPVSWRHNGEVDGGCGKHEAISGLEIYLASILAYIFWSNVGPRYIYEKAISVLRKYLAHILGDIFGSNNRPIISNILGSNIFGGSIFGGNIRPRNIFAPWEWSPAWPCTRPTRRASPPWCSLLSGWSFGPVRIIILINVSKWRWGGSLV